ncbi:MAG: hypothetical protein ACLFTK_11970 [Anaerolineales bacterium]
MLTKSLANYIGVSTRDVQTWLNMSAAGIYDDPAYQDLVYGLDRALLEETLSEARAVYEDALPEFQAALGSEYNFRNTPMSAYTLGNWLVGFLQYPDSLPELLDIHARIPQSVLTAGLPMLLSYLDDMPQGGAEWQRALAILALPMMSEGA